MKKITIVLLYNRNVPSKKSAQANCFWFAFGKYSLRISTGAPSTLSDIFLVFTQCLQTNDRTLLKV